MAPNREIFSLLQVSRNVASTLELEPLLDLILEQIKAAIPYTESLIFTAENGEMSVLSYSGPSSRQDVFQLRFSVRGFDSPPDDLNLYAPVFVPDIQTDTRQVHTLNEAFSQPLTAMFGDVRSWMWVPLLVKEQLVGAVVLGHQAANRYSGAQADLILVFAYQIAVAIENARLYLRVKQHSDELEAVFMVQQAITSRLDSEAILRLIADAALRLTSSWVSIVYLVEGDDLRIAALAGEHQPNGIGVGYRVPISQSITGSAVRLGQSIHVYDIHEDSRVHIDFVRRVDISCYLAVPMLVGSEARGVIAVGNKVNGKLGPDEERVLGLLATGAVIALENARLYQEEQQRRQVAESLRDMLALLNSNRSVDEILDCLVNQAGLLLKTKASAVLRLQEAGKFTARASHGLSDDYLKQTSAFMSQRPIALTLTTRRPVILSNLADMLEFSDDLDLKTSLAPVFNNGFKSMLAVPLVVKDEVYGSLTLYYTEPRNFSTDEIELAITFCDQAALAIENARLQAQAEEAAVMAERNRLARDLHDAVSQTLFSASLIAGVLPRLMDRDLNESKRKAVELRQLTRGALAEMRTLLLELRPAALAEAKLDDLMKHLVEAANSRTQTAIELELEGNCLLPLDVKLVLYRITQEALNNLVKHAEAKNALVRLQRMPEQVSLWIKDDGRGFKPARVRSGHFGLSIMRERAESVGATFSLYSQPGQGTHIDVIWSQAQKGVAYDDEGSAYSSYDCG